MGNCKRFLLLALGLCMQMYLFAQSAASSPTNDGFMRSEAKINVVMAVVLTVLAGLFIFLLRLDKKITKLEKGDNQL